jgi:PAS domain S-box-containing protein
MQILHKILTEYTIFENKFLNRTLLVSLAMGTILPLFVVFYIHPSFTRLLVESTKDDAMRVARYFASQFISEKEELTGASLKKYSIQEIEKLKDNFELTKLKIFSKSGEAIFSTDPEEEGEVHKNKYIYEIIKNRKTYAEIVQKGTETSEGQKVLTDVVETYVPLMKDGRFLGVFEVYYDVSVRKGQLDKLLMISATFVFTIASGLLIVIIVVLFKENKSMKARKRSVDALRESEVLNRTVLNSMHANLAILDREGNITAVNHGWESFARVNGDPDLTNTCVGINYLNVCRQASADGAESAQSALEGIQAVLDGSKPLFTLEYDCHSPEEERCFLLYTTPLQSNLAGAVVSHIDITQRKHAEVALLETEMRFRTLFQTIPDSITVSRLADGLITDVNDGFTGFSGYSRREVIGVSSLDLNLWDDPEDRKQMVALLQESEQLDNFEARFKRKDGRVIEALVSARVFRLKEEPHIISVVRDISDLKLAEKKITAANRFLRIANRHTEMDPLLNDFVTEIEKLTGCAAVGMRILDDQGYIPYKAYAGFSKKFYESESHLSIHSEQCMCMRVVRKETDRKSPYFTGGGSFHTGSTEGFVASFPDAQKKQYRNTCSAFGYESVALVPIRAGDQFTGLIHVADPRQNKFSLEMVEMLERAAIQLGTAIERVRAEQALLDSHRDLERKVADRTAELVRANEQLQREIGDRRRTEQDLLRHQGRLRSLTSELLLTEERERRRIATELHDRIGQTLAVSRIKLGALRESAGPGGLARKVDEIRGFIEQTIQDTSTLTFELSPPALYELGLEAALEGLVEQIQELHGLEIEFRDDGRTKPLDGSCRVVAYMAARELLFNIVKHAGAVKAQVAICRDNDTLRIDIQDDGAGFEPSERSYQGMGNGGFGLFSIRERLRLLSGRLEVESAPGRGTRIRMVLPLSREIAKKENEGS